MSESDARMRVFTRGIFSHTPATTPDPEPDAGTEPDVAREFVRRLFGRTTDTDEEPPDVVRARLVAKFRSTANRGERK